MSDNNSGIKGYYIPLGIFGLFLFIIIPFILFMYLTFGISSESSKPTTPVLTTSSPTTQSPTTQSPTTSVPTTSVPTTSVPTTPVPTTSVPTTLSPTTFVPTPSLTTFIPTTSGPTSAPITTVTPVPEYTSTPAPTTPVPTTLPPAYDVQDPNKLVKIDKLMNNTIFTVKDLDYDTLDEMYQSPSYDNQNKYNELLVAACRFSSSKCRDSTNNMLISLNTSNDIASKVEKPGDNWYFYWVENGWSHPLLRRAIVKNLLTEIFYGDILKQYPNGFTCKTTNC